ncbi:sulfurtransferase complex subunit TusD [Psychrobacter sp. DM8]|uniref:sulfurtransferase complex subunit TusD n=1 Tax=unclassified Psychrobacter TaxID=196806 RepID=UPI003F4FCD84
MTTKDTVLLLTKDPSHPLASLAVRYARAYLQNRSDNNDDSKPLKVFFYADAAHIANRLRWQSADQINVTREWQALAEQYPLSLPVCVSTALSRGISDIDNSARHHLEGDNMADGFTLVGLGELAMMIQGNCRLLQF